LSAFAPLREARAAILSRIRGTTVPYAQVSDEDYIEARMSEGFPDFPARFLLGWVRGMSRGEWDQQTGDLRALLGRPPTTIEEALSQVFGERANRE
jgi:NAD(P)H dehydrogenase (quinone)